MTSIQYKQPVLLFQHFFHVIEEHCRYRQTYTLEITQDINKVISMTHKRTNIQKILIEKRQFWNIISIRLATPALNIVFAKIFTTRSSFNLIQGTINYPH